jgi:hypothetical protein
MRIDSSGNVGIGITSPSSYARICTSSTVTLSNDSTYGLSLSDATTLNKRMVLGYYGTGGNGYGVIQSVYSGTAWTDTVINPNGGNVLVGTTNASFTAGSGVKLGLDTTGPAVVCVGAGTSASYNSYFIYSTGAGANRFYVSYAGQINATSTSINGISDISLKENIRDLETGLNEVMALKPRRFDWKEETKLDLKNVAGFVAQELEQVMPDLVYEYQYNETETKKSIKMGDILPTLVKAIQELKAINDTQAATINALTARIEVLENKA